MKNRCANWTVLIIGFVVTSAILLMPAVAEVGSGDAEVCRYKCPGSSRLVPRSNHRRSSNGCGTAGFSLPVTALPHPDFEKCCNDHDLCYDTCNADKAGCDAGFDSCLRQVCDSKVADGGRENCAATANLFTSMSKTLGCEPFLKSQKEACSCEVSGEL